MTQQPWERPPWVGGEIYRYGVEAVPFVEGALAGAIVGEITRLSREPRFSGHSAFARPETNAGALLWTFLRLGIGPDHAAAILDNHLSRVTLLTDPRGREALLQLRRSVLEPLFNAVQKSYNIPDAKAGSYF